MIKYNYSQTFFTSRIATSFYFSVSNLMAIFWGEPLAPLTEQKVHQMAPPRTVVTISSAAYYSFIDPERMKGWVGLVGWSIYPHKWSPVSCRSSAGQRKLASQRPTFYRWATEPVLIGYCQHHYCLSMRMRMGSWVPRAKPISLYIFDPTTKIFWPKYSSYVDRERSEQNGLYLPSNETIILVTANTLIVSPVSVYLYVCLMQRSFTFWQL